MAAALEFFGTDATGRFVLLGLLIGSLLLTVLACKVAGKAGFSPALGLITLIPLGFLIFLAILALAA
jgi:hypothetical protein